MDRDCRMLYALVRYRVLSYDQVRRSYFPGNKSLISRRMKKLEKAGWITRFADVSAIGGQPVYVFPTEKTMLWARAKIDAEIRGTSHETLVRSMLPQTTVRPFVPKPRTAPAFLPHQLAVNDVAMALDASGLEIDWLSTWNRPFPNTFEGLSLPQPDFVLVLRTNGEPKLFLGEVDRGNESLAHFNERKVGRAVALDHFKPTLARLAGFDAFTMPVVVEDVVDGKPLERITKLVDLAIGGYGSSLMAFTCLPWLKQDVTGQIWFMNGSGPKTDDPQPSRHINLAFAWNTSETPVALNSGDQG